MKLGTAFSDSLTLERKPSGRFPKEAVHWWWGAGRPLLFATIFAVSFFALFLRLAHLTVVRGHELRRLSDENRIRELIRHAPRGILRDRTGKSLVANIPSFRLIAPCEGKAPGTCTRRVTQEEGEKLKKEGLLPGHFLEVDWQRQYPLGEAAAHVVGYTGELSAEELAHDYYSLRGYKPGDRVGRMGAEATFEERLRGRDGKELVEVDATGKIIRTLGRQAEMPGEDISLAIDTGLQRAAAATFPLGKRGAVVVTKPTTGEILTLYSSPAFSPYKFSVGMTQEDYQVLTNDPDQPLFNRSIGGVYPPGSTFKIVTALAGLEEGAISRQTTVEDTGIITIGPFTFPNWYFTQYGKTDGIVDIVKGLQRSNDIFFYKVGEWLGITRFVEWARRVGIGKPLGIELAGEAGGLMPDPSWKAVRFDSPLDREKRNDQWYLGDTYHVAIGQGYLLTTPLQVNAWTNVIADGGKLCKPTVEKVQSSIRQLADKVQSCKDLGIKGETIDLITEGMRRACSPGGTGWPLFNFSVIRRRIPSETRDPTGPDGDPSVVVLPQDDQKLVIPVACKTGTAEFADPDNRTHAWFTVFAPLKLGSDLEKLEGLTHSGTDILTGEPEISITVLVEGSGEGSNVAAPIAKKILEEWFGR